MSDASLCGGILIASGDGVHDGEMLGLRVLPDGLVAQRSEGWVAQKQEHGAYDQCVERVLGRASQSLMVGQIVLKVTVLVVGCLVGRLDYLPQILDVRIRSAARR